MILSRMSAADARAKRTRLFGVAVVLLLIGAAALWRAQLSEVLWRTLTPVMNVRFGSDASSTNPASLILVTAERDALYQENLELKARLGRDARVVRILGAVLLRPPATPYDTLVIDAGSVEGVAVGDLVSSGGTIVIGTISEVYARAARVTLYSAPGQRYDALLRGVIPLAIEGQGGGSLQARLPAGSAVSVGDSALLPGIAGGLSARVSRIERGDGESFVTLYFSLPVDMLGLRFVEVWKQPNHVTE